MSARVHPASGEPWRVDFSDDLALPASVLSERMAFIGVSGSGKTYGAGKLVEGLLAVGGQVVILDNVGNWWGLRLLADGKTPGFSIPLLGGDRGDIALEPEHGKLAAATVAESKSPMIIDVSMFTPDELHGTSQIPGFMPTFCTELLALKRRSPSPVLIVWEECHESLPQTPSSKAEVRTLAAAQRLIKKGRNYGVGTLLISQRVAAVSKDVLHQCEWLFAYRTPGKNDRKAVTEWVQHAAGDDLMSDGTLPQLATGVCMAWTPERFDAKKRLRAVKVAPKRTFDSTKTPDMRDFAQVAAAVLTPVDLDRFKKRMEAGIAKARDNDPDVLRRRVAELEAWIAQHGKAGAPAQVPTVAEVLDSPEWKARLREYGHQARQEALREASETVAGRMRMARTQLVDVANTLHVDFDELRSKMPTEPGILVDANSLGGPNNLTYPEIMRQAAALPVDSAADAAAAKALAQRATARRPANGEIGACASAIAKALLQLSPATRTQIATLAGYSRNSGSFAAGMAEAKAHGLFQTEMTAKGLMFVPTDAARRLHPDARPLTPAALLAMWRQKLDGRGGDLLQIVVNYGARGISRATLAEVASMSANSGSFAAYLADLTRNDLVTKAGGMYVADPLFRSR